MTLQTYYNFVLPSIILVMAMTATGVLHFQLWLKRRKKRQRIQLNENLDGDGI